MRGKNLMNLKTGMTGTILGLALVVGATGCKSNSSQPATIVDANNGPDPAAANLAPTDQSASTAPVATTSSTSTAQPSRVLGQRAYSSDSSNGESYPQNTGGAQNGSYDPDYDQYENQVDSGQQALYADQAPPPLPTYEQPELTEPGYEWTPGYWDYGSGGYYWVPGAWVAPPYQQALWTPGYWGYESDRYRFHRGYWARHIGFYGGISYGFGYGGFGYDGGYWNNNQFYYNNNVNRINVNSVRFVYSRNVQNNYNNRVSYNGPGGIRVQARPQELAVLREQRTPPMQVQVQRVQAAQQNRAQFFAENHGRPAVAAATERFSADRNPPQAIRQNAATQQNAQRGGFGQAGVNNQLQQRNAQQQVQQRQQQALQQQQQQKAQQLNQQHNAQAQQQNQVREQQQQRTQQLNQQHNTQAVQQQQVREQTQQRAVQQNQQRNVQVQQQQQAREQTQQRAVQQQNVQREQQVQRQPQAQQARPQAPAQQARPQAQVRPQPAARPAPAAAAPHGEEHPH